jgi:sec-independent protein translocase protein TatB
MFNIGPGEFALIAVAALLVLGPKRLPELARGLGKFMREFRRQTDEVRGVVEREFYRMDQDLADPPPSILPAQGAVASHGPPTTTLEPEVALPPLTEVTHSQAMMPPGRPTEEVKSHPGPEASAGANPVKPA